jgi:ATP-dependent exoDNAse (exonuclease V) alpha subunit
MHLPQVDLEDSERFSRIQGDLAQMAAARSIIQKPVTLISGRGGTGKTEVVSAVLKAAEEGLKKAREEENSLISEDGVDSSDSFMTSDLGGGGDIEPPREREGGGSNGPMLYCAPTGKAASVIKKRVGAKAFTIHQVLASYKLWRTGGQEQPWKFGETRVVAVDECSMVSIEIFHLLLKYLLEGSALAKVVVLGDHLQLPSVDPGNFMEDLWLALKPRGYTVNLLTNHRSSGSLIFSNATRISQQQMPEFDSGRGFSLILPQGAGPRGGMGAVPRTARAGAAVLPPCTAPPPCTTKGKGKEPDMAKQLMYWALIKENRKRSGASSTSLI